MIDHSSSQSMLQSVSTLFIWRKYFLMCVLRSKLSPNCVSLSVCHCYKIFHPPSDYMCDNIGILRIVLLVMLRAMTEKGSEVSILQPWMFVMTCSLLASLSLARPSPLEFWLCASDFNPFNLIISQPVTRERCEVVTNPRTSTAEDNEDDRKPIIQHFG